MTAATRSRGPGRPRDPAIDVAVLNATLAVLSRDGYGGFSVDAIAAEAGVSKPTIYRRWPSKKALILAAAEQLSHTIPVPESGDLRSDLEAIVVGLANTFGAPATDRLVAALVAGMAQDPELATAVRTGFLGVRRDAARVVLERASARGEIESGVDLDLAIDLLASPLYYRLLVTGDTIDRTFATQVVDVVISWASGTSGRRTRAEDT